MSRRRRNPVSYITCPFCGHSNSYDPEEQDVIACDNCDQLIFIPEALVAACVVVLVLGLQNPVAIAALPVPQRSQAILPQAGTALRQ